MNEKQTAQLMAILAAAYPNFEVSEITHRVWYRMLADVEYADGEAAAEYYIKTEHFPPAIADIRSLATAMGRAAELTAGEAWGEFIDAIRRFGHNRPTEGKQSLSPRTRKVAEAMGWYDCCMSENVDVLRGQFMRIYEQIEQRDKRQELMAPARKELNQ